MKKLLLIGFLFAGLTTLFTSCKKDEGGSTATTPVAEKITVTLSAPTVEFNGFDQAIITVKDQTGADVTSSCSIYANANPITNRFTPSGTGSYVIYAKKGTLKSDDVTLAVNAATTSPFTKKILVEDCTGAWCGFCTRIANSLENYKTTHPNCVVMTVHGGGGTDPYKFQYYSSFNSSFSVSGYPTAILNRRSTWTENTADLNAEFTKYAPLGLAVESSVSGTNVTGKVKVKFNVTTDQSMKLVVALVENGLVYSQANYYSPSGGYTPHLYGGQNPITNFSHNGVLRKTATDLFGDAIPVTAQVKNNVYEFPFSISTAGTTSSGASFTINTAKSAIVAYVIDGSSAKKGAYNVQYAAVGSVKNFD